MDNNRNVEINLDVRINEQHKWSISGGATTKLTIPEEFIHLLDAGGVFALLIESAYQEFVMKTIENEDSERNSSSTTEE